jgi:hypothetical protein
MLFESTNVILKLNTMSQPKIKVLQSNWNMREHNSKKTTQFVSIKINQQVNKHYNLTFNIKLQCILIN